VPDRRTHRGPHPQDARLFAPDVWPRLRQATSELAWLLSRGYAPASSLKLVGDRHDLVARQRTAIARSAASDAELARRREHEFRLDALADRRVWLDGYNVLTTVEAALAGGVILGAMDGCYRDMASMHGSYRKVAETRPALELIGRTLVELKVGACRWYLDRPVSNSGRLAALLKDTASAHGWTWEVELVQDPDPLLRASEEIIATADSQILNRCQAWIHLARETVTRYVPEAYVVDLGKRP